MSDLLDIKALLDEASAALERAQAALKEAGKIMKRNLNAEQT